MCLIQGNGILHITDDWGKFLIAFCHALQQFGTFVAAVHQIQPGDDTLVLFFYPVGVLNRFDGFVFKGCYCGFQVLFQFALFLVVKGLLCPVI